MFAFMLESGAFAPMRGSRGASLTPHQRFPLRFRTRPIACNLQAPASPSQSVKETAKKADALLDAGLAIVVLKRGKAHLFRVGRNPMVFAGSAERHIPLQNRKIQDCDPVAVCNGSFTCLGFGFYNPHSMFRVRIMHHCPDVDEESIPKLPWDYEREIVSKLENAVMLRSSIGLPDADTNVYRLVNGEGDRLSGLVVDRIGDTLVVASSALWCEKYDQQIISGLAKVLPDCHDVIWRRNVDRLKQDGWQKESSMVPEPLTAKQDEKDIADPPMEEGGADGVEAADIVVKECGIQYALSRFALTRGQKTGHYADQRENRLFLRELIRKRGSPSKVLDLFCYTGGFALNAALGKEGTTVVAVDSSEKALVMGRKSAELNGLSSNIQFVRADVTKYIRANVDQEGESFDVVVVDPPKFAPNIKALMRAVHKYRSLNVAALSMVKKGGILCTCSCSAAITQQRSVFIETIRQAGKEVGRDLTLIKTFGAASDHPITPEMPETEYLTMCVFVCW